MSTVRIGSRLVGDGQPSLIVGEIGINANGDVNIAKQLITAAAQAGCEAVKFQKRTVDVVYSEEELARPRESPFGTTNGDLKRGLEFGVDEYFAIDAHCAELGIMWSASPWDVGSVGFLESFFVPFYKVASASITDSKLLWALRNTGRPVILSTGMSTMQEITDALMCLVPHNTVMLHCTSTYPSAPDEINLRAMASLKKRYGVAIGFSSHEVGTAASIAAVALGACIVERHITLSRDMWGSDQAASLEMSEFARMIADIRTVEQALGDGVKTVYDSEIPIREKLRKI